MSSATPKHILVSKYGQNYANFFQIWAIKLDKIIPAYTIFFLPLLFLRGVVLTSPGPDPVTVTIEPAVDPAVIVEPAVDPAVIVEPAVDPAVGPLVIVKPAVDPAEPVDIFQFNN